MKTKKSEKWLPILGMLSVFFFLGMMFTTTNSLAWDEKYDGPPWPSSTPEPIWHGPIPYKGLDKNWNVPQFNRQVVEASYGWGADNPDKIKDLIPEPLYQILKEPEVWGHARVNVCPYLKFTGTLMSLYDEATEKYKGQSKIVDEELVNYTAGCPFPDPKTGWELMYNVVNYPTACDKYREGNVPLTNRNKHVKYIGVRNVEWYSDSRLGDPNGLIYKPNPKGIRSMQTFPCTYPYDLQGIIPWRYRYFDPKKYDDMWMYLPSLRRVRRMSAAAMEDKLPGGQDITWEICQPIGMKESQWDWKLLGKKKMLCPVAKTQSKWIAGDYIANPNGYYHLVDGYLLEAISRDPNHTSQRWVAFVRSDIWHTSYTEVYDKRGRLYMFRILPKRPLGGTGIPEYDAMTFLDMERRHSTFYIIPEDSVNNMVKPEYFLIKNLKRQFPGR